MNDFRRTNCSRIGWRPRGRGSHPPGGERVEGTNPAPSPSAPSSAPPRDLATVAMANSLSPRVLSGRLYFRLTCATNRMSGGTAHAAACRIDKTPPPEIRMSVGRRVLPSRISDRRLKITPDEKRIRATSSARAHARRRRETCVEFFLALLRKAVPRRYMKFGARNIRVLARDRRERERGHPSPVE